MPELAATGTDGNVTPLQKRRGFVLPSTGEREAVRKASDLFEKDRRQRIEFERDWYMNLAFYFGRQYVQWTTPMNTSNGTYMKLFEPKAPPWRVRMVTNKIKPLMRKEMAMLTKEDPVPYIIPASTDDDDLLAARAGENLFDFLWRNLKAKRTLKRAAFWTALTGNGFCKDWYDPGATDAGGEQGSIMFEHLTPFHLWVPDMDEEDIENQPHVHHVMTKDPRWIKDTYGVDIQSDTNSGGGAVLEQKFLRALNITSSNEYDCVAVHETWFKPCSDWPDGAIITWAQDQPLNVTEGFPFGHNEYPFTKFDNIQTGRFYSESVIKDLIPLQKEYNRTRSQIIEAKNRMARPQLVAQKGSVDPNKMTTEPGLIIFYTPGYQPPVQMKMEPIPNYVIEELNRCAADMQDIAAQHEVSKGTNPPGVTAATAISYLQEQDETSLSNAISSIEEGVEKIGRHFLLHVQTFWDLPRMIQVEGYDGAFEAMEFKNADLKGNTDLNIQSGSAMPKSRAAKQAFIMQLGQLGWIPAQTALRYLDMAETGRLYEELQKDVRQAQRENVKMMAGMPQQVNTWDEHLIHITTHNDDRKKQKFEQADPQVKALYEEHVNMHQQAMQLNMMQAGQMGIAPPGGDPAGGGAPGGPPALGGGGANPITRPAQLPPVNIPAAQPPQ